MPCISGKFASAFQVNQSIDLDIQQPTSHHETLIIAATSSCSPRAFNMSASYCRTHLELGRVGLNLPILVQLQTLGKCPFSISDREAIGHTGFPDHSYATR
jgi:hypothetical protein